MVLPLDDGKKRGDPDLRPGVLQHSSSIHRRRPDVAGPSLPAVMTLDGGEKSGGRDLRAFFTTCECQRRMYNTLGACTHL